MVLCALHMINGPRKGVVFLVLLCILTLLCDVRWNSLAAQLQSILEQRPQIELFIDSVQHLKASEKIPKLDAEYWILTEENYALLQMFLEVNLIITVEDQPTF